MSHRIIKTTLFCILSLLATFLFTSMPAQAAIDPTAQVVYLRQSCVDNGLPLNNCFTTMSDLVAWITNIRIPQQTNPLLVEIGPGTFSGAYVCNNGAYVTLQGSGRQNTTIGPGPGEPYGMELGGGCTLDVRDLTINGGSLGGVSHSGGGGVTTWTNVDLISTAYGWTEGCSGGSSKHYWFSSRIVTSTGQGQARAYSTCSENWFFGSEITAMATGGIEAVALVTKPSGTHENHVYGSVIRAIANAGVILPPAAPSNLGTVKGLVAVAAGLGGTIHIHGTGIDVISTEGNQIAALLSSNGGFIHANGSSYNMSTGTGGKLTRILNNGGHVHAPYLWEQHPQPPSIVSVDGADIAVQTNCAASGCQTTGTETHLLIYNSSCTGIGGPWFDVVTRACR